MNCSYTSHLKVLRLNDLTMILDSVVYLKRANCAVSKIHDTEVNRMPLQPISKPTHLTFGLHFDEYGWHVLHLSYGSMSGMYYAYHTMLLGPWFITKGTIDLSFSTHCALSIDEADKLSHTISENRHCLMLLKCIQM